MPFVERLARAGLVQTGECVMPSFTNPNNMSIATGVPTKVHGICGNTFFDPASGSEVLMNDPQFLRAPTIFESFEQVGARTAIVTAKDKLRRLLGHRLRQSVCFSAEKADIANKADNGIDHALDFVGHPLPSVYSADLSEFVMAAGVRLLETTRPDLMYLSLTDFIQHKYAPGTPEANDFYAMLDAYLARLDAHGAVIVVTGDHGMTAKHGPDGKPQVVYLQEWLNLRFGQGSGNVVLPITDPYTRHHGALGSFATIYLNGRSPGDVADELREVPGVAEVLTQHVACDRFALPPDRIGDLVVVSDHDFVLGRSPADHDMSHLDRPLRSHGGLTEQRVPFIVNRPTTIPEGHQLRNLDSFWVGLNHVEHAGVAGY
jgi:phosphonoacetate hydrolase